MKINIVVYLLVILSKIIYAQENAIIIQDESDNKIKISVYSNDNFQQYKLDLIDGNWKFESDAINKSAEIFIKNTGVYDKLSISENINELIKKIQQGGLVQKNLVLMNYKKEESINKEFINDTFFKITDTKQNSEKIKLLSIPNILLGIILILNLIVLVIILKKRKDHSSNIYNKNMQPNTNYSNENTGHRKSGLQNDHNKELPIKPIGFDSIELQLSNIMSKLNVIKDTNDQLLDLQFINKSAGTTHIEKIKELMKEIYETFNNYQKPNVNEDKVIESISEINQLLSELPTKIIMPEINFSQVICAIEELKTLVTVSNNNKNSKYEGF